jgi:signal transduction histidine kinase
MTHGQVGRAGRAPGRGRLGGALTIAASIALLATSVAFTWLRVTLPSEPARISSDAWPWTAVGVEVIPMGENGPFRDGDVVEAVDGANLESLMASPLAPGSSRALPSPLGFDLIRGGASVRRDVALAQQPIGALIVNGLPLLGYTLVQALVAGLAWLRRPFEGWRRGFLIGSAANIASALIWELGLRASDVINPQPLFALFVLSAPMHLLFWSSVVHVLVSWPRRWEAVAGRRWLIAALYLLPQVALLTGVALARAVTPTSLAWVDAWDRVLALIVLVNIALVLAALARAYFRTPAGRDAWLRVVAAACLAVALAVGGLTVLPTLVLGHPLVGRAAVAALALPLAVVLIVGTLRSRLFEVDVLLASRRRLVVAREEERRRIRRDLHDGIGPMLAAMTLKVDLARDVLRTDPDAADTALESLKRDTQAAVAEIRRLTRELRPPALDELGVVEAIRHRADELAGGAADERLAIEVTTAGAIPPLDAAVEAAAYRIAVEAMTNVVRHARARHCRVRVSGNGVLVLEISDDGAGFAAGRGAGVGMTSMRERCAELGGSLAVERTPDGWTVVRATLPVSS